MYSVPPASKAWPTRDRTRLISESWTCATHHVESVSIPIAPTRERLALAPKSARMFSSVRNSSCELRHSFTHCLPIHSGKSEQDGGSGQLPPVQFDVALWGDSSLPLHFSRQRASVARAVSSIADSGAPRTWAVGIVALIPVSLSAVRGGFVGV